MPGFVFGGRWKIRRPFWLFWAKNPTPRPALRWCCGSKPGPRIGPQRWKIKLRILRAIHFPGCSMASMFARKFFARACNPWLAAPGFRRSSFRPAPAADRKSSRQMQCGVITPAHLLNQNRNDEKHSRGFIAAANEIQFLWHSLPSTFLIS